MLKGFTIGGFRSFSNPPAWIKPLGRINIFIGANNSGKSNILRYVQKVLIPSFNDGGQTGNLAGIDQNAGQNGPPYVQVLTDIDLETLASRLSLRADVIEKALTDFMSGNLLISTVRFPSKDRPNDLFPIESFPAPSGNPNRALEQFWQKISNTSGGGYREHWYPQVANWVSRFARKGHSCHYIKTFRTLPTRLSEFEVEYPASQGHHLIDELAAIERPRWNEQNKKNDFIKLERFVQTLLENDTTKIEISADKSHVIVQIDNKSIPLEALGSGIHEVFMLAAEVVLRDDDIILLEEPETHLHPTLQRKLMLFLNENTRSQLFITTHSAAILDTAGANVFEVAPEGGNTIVIPLITSQDKFLACANLGYRASDILQSNCLIWVEGPSDRIYLKDWLRKREPKLIENVHYSIMFYGGRLASHLSFDEDISELIQLLSINRRSVILLDSDQGAQHQKIRATKSRLMAEIENIGGISWLTEGREIENYYSISHISTAISKVHKNVISTNTNANRYAKSLIYRTVGSSEDKVANKILVAEWLTQNCDPEWSQLGLETKIRELIDFIWDSNF